MSVLGLQVTIFFFLPLSINLSIIFVIILLNIWTIKTKKYYTFLHLRMTPKNSFKKKKSNQKDKIPQNVVYYNARQIFEKLESWKHLELMLKNYFCCQLIYCQLTFSFQHL